MASDDPNLVGTKQPIPLTEAIHSPSPEVMKAAAADPELTEDLGLSLLKRADLPGEVLEQLGKNGGLMKHRKLKLALVEHARTPRHVSVPLIRSLFTFDLMLVALAPAVPADVKIAAEEALLNRLETISSGERLSLAHRASGRVAGMLLQDAEPRVVQAALENARLTEAGVIKALMRAGAPASLVEALCYHPKWSVRREIRIALLHNERTPLPQALEFARSLPSALVHEILQDSHLPGDVKSHVLQELQNR